MARFEVSFEVEVPDNATRKDVEEWVRFGLRDKCELALKNPMSDRDLEAAPRSVTIRDLVGE